ncbi:MAG: nitroreductase family protein [Anaerolineales bacterium]|nr:nitroreductase family protein [Anaerolineales bacterium]
MIRDLIIKNRSYRRFYQDVPVAMNFLQDLVDLARQSPSAANKQPLKYILSNQPAVNELIFSQLAWAGYLKDWPGPEEGEKPAAYILILADRKISRAIDCDHGIAAQSILLGAAEIGLGGCILSSIDREKVSEALDIPSDLEILLAIALGKPKETVILEEMPEDGDFKYWRDAEGRHHVPKRSLSEIVSAEFSA